MGFKIVLQKVRKKWETKRSFFELLRDHTLFISPLVCTAEERQTVSSFSRCFINIIATCDSSLDSSDTIEQRSAGYFLSASSVSEIASLT